MIYIGTPLKNEMVHLDGFILINIFVVKMGHLHNREGLLQFCKKINTKKTKDYSASNTSSTVRAYHVAYIQSV